MIFPCFHEVWTGITVLTVTNFLSLRLRKIRIFQVEASEEDACNRRSNHPLHPFPCPLSTTNTFINN